MILGKIDPPAKIVQQIDLFSYQEITGSFICADTKKYVLGQNSAQFTTIFGELKEDSFKILTRINNEVSGETIEEWGTDDSVVLQKLAELNGTTVTQIITSSIDLSNIF